MTSRVLTRAVGKAEPWLTEVRKIWIKSLSVTQSVTLDMQLKNSVPPAPTPALVPLIKCNNLIYLEADVKIRDNVLKLLQGA